MSEKKNKSFFWASYADLMTSLFFVMLMLFVVAVVQLNKEGDRVRGENENLKGKLEKAQEIEDATTGLDQNYFQYIDKYKKHKLTVDVQFPRGSAELSQVSQETLDKLKAAGDSARAFIDRTTNKYTTIQYILIIEGQASREYPKPYEKNYELSYERALALKKYWEHEGVTFADKNCEVLICGSGDGTQSGTGLMREEIEENNQRFLIHILPKPGVIKQISEDNAVAID